MSDQGNRQGRLLTHALGQLITAVVVVVLLAALLYVTRYGRA